MCAPSPDESSPKRRNTTEQEVEEETPPNPATPPHHPSPPPPAPHAGGSPPPPLVPAEPDSPLQLPNDDLFDNLSPLEVLPLQARWSPPKNLDYSMPWSNAPPSPSWVLPSFPWISKYESFDKNDSYPAPPHETMTIPMMIPPTNILVLKKMVGAGLANLGNTCFMNSILQCFTHTVPLVQGLRSCTHSSPCGKIDDGFCVICALREHVEQSLAASGGLLFPTVLADNLNFFSSTFVRNQQEDAHEFMQCALNKLARRFQDLKEKNEISEEEDNLVEKVFGGRLLSKLRCCNCGHCSDTYEPLIDLSLEIQNVDTLLSALESFTKVEKIDEKFTCDSCKEDVSMEKQLILNQTPSIAAFHLKRFKKDGDSVKKIDNHVNFPLELDLQPYTTCNHNDNVLSKYDLYAVVVHIGFSPNSGHYFCFVRSAPDTWHKLEDSKVTMVLGDSVLAQKAYILFYARQGTSWVSSIMEAQRPSLSDNSVRGEASESKEFDEQMSDYSCGGKLLGDDDPLDAYDDSVGLDDSADSDTTHTQVPP